MKPDELLARLDPEQAAVARAIDGPVVVLAGAGTGKTRAITHRMAYAAAVGAHDPYRTMAVTFTNRAAGEMTRRLAELGVEGVRVRTFHAAALKQLAWAWPQVIGGEMFQLTPSKAGSLANASARLGLGSEVAFLRDVASEIEWAKVSQVTPDDYASVAATKSRLAPGGLEREKIAELYEEYERIKSESHRIDFEDVLLLTVGILESRPEIREQVQKSFRHFTVDEFQDVSGIQSRLLDAWLGRRDDICVVGDPAQTIYSFAGADASFLQSFGRRFADSTMVRLARCYRCTPEVVDVATGVLVKSATPARLQSMKPAGPRVTYAVFDDELAEADSVAEQIKELRASGVSARDIAILVRINAMTEPFEAALAERQIPYSVRGGLRFFDRPEVRQAISLIRGAAKASTVVNGQDQEDLGRLTRAILTGVGWSDEPPVDIGAERERWESIAALVTLADDVAARDSKATLVDLAGEIDHRKSTQDAPEVDGVTIASLHSAKGMEWDNVFLVGLSEGVMPFSQAETPDQLAEEQRLLYVGITRAADRLALSSASTRGPGARTRRPSRFLPKLQLAADSKS
ncbi:MAG: ATP-dependent helicase [Candidatus Nanopelagicales bacterium]